MASTHLSEQLIKYFFTADALAARPTGWSVSLHTGDPGATGANEVVVGQDANYVRQGATLVAEADGTIWIAKNSADVVFSAAAAGADYTASHFGFWDNNGNWLGGAPFAGGVTKQVSAGTVISFAANDLVAEGTVNG